jgi:hypothetical protein
MSVIASIDCGYLATVQAMADELWTDPIKNIDLIASVESARAVLENQRVNFVDLQSKTKEKKVSIEWLQVCDLEVQTCSDDCSIDGEDATPVCKEYELTCLGELAFKVFDRVYRERTIEAQQSVAYNLEMRKKAIDEALAQATVAGLLLNAGTNAYTGGIGTVTAGLTTIAAANWNDNIWGYLALVARMNKFNSPYGDTGYNLFQLIYNRLAEIANADGKGNVAKMGDLKSRMYLDPENVEVVAPGYTFLIHKTAVALLNKAWYPVGAANAVNLTADRMAWSESSRNLPGIFYDVFTERGCESNDYYTAYKVQAHGLFAVNPTPCSETNTGILAFSCE